MKSKMVKIFLVMLVSSFSQNIYAEYETKSIFSESYKCTATKSGGFRHSGSGSNLVIFRPDEEYFLTHISNIPKEVIFKMIDKPIIDSLGNNEDRIREAVEKRYMKQINVGDEIVIEESSYFIRTQEENPKDRITYFNACTRIKGSYISCYEGNTLTRFHFFVETGRFVYSYAGTWHSPSKQLVEDSSFIFGECKKYFM